MNRIKTSLQTLLAILLLSATFTSCDDDIEQAYDLSGIWQGTIIGDFYFDRFGYNDTWETEIEFVQDGSFSNGGYGFEVDYPLNGGRPVRAEFDWEVRNGRIHMRYDDGYRVIIDRYDMHNRNGRWWFSGFFTSYHTGEQIASFNLVKVAGWQDWSNWSRKQDTPQADGGKGGNDGK